MPYTFTSTFENVNDAIIGLAEASSTISDLLGIDKNDIPRESTRMVAIQNLASEIVDNPPDVNNESYPQVPSFSVNAYNFFFRSDKNIGFGVNYNRDDNTWIATISLYLSSRLFKTNPCAKFLQNSEFWMLMPYTPRKNRKKTDDSVNIDEGNTMQTEVEE